MRVLLQRVASAAVEVDGQTVGRIGPGLLLLLGIRTGDSPAEARFLADKCVNLRIFEDDDGKMNRSVLELGGELLVISQFTLYGDARKGRRPSFVEAAPPAISEPLYLEFVSLVGQSGLKTETGIFGASMNVQLVNQGPVTIWLEKEPQA